jgi:hypothetical protein
MKSEFNALLQKRQQIEATLAKLREEDRGLERRIEELQQKERNLSANVDASERRVTEIQKKIQLRLRVTYMTSTIAAAPELSGLSAKGQLERLSYYMRKVRDFDARLFREASEAIATLHLDRSALREALESQTKVREELRAKKSSVEAEAEKLKVVTDELAQRQRAAQAALVRLQHEAKRVEAMIAEITSKEDDDEERDATPTPESGSTPPSQPDVAEDLPVIPKEIVYPSIFDSIGKLAAPVKGEVIQGFGRSKMTSFADMVRSKGIEFSTAKESEVYAVLDGRVAYVGVMPGYEQVVVVEHGGRSYSLYGRLANVTVKAGDRVAKDQSFATTSPPDEKGRTFYFEIRKNGVPVNPEPVLVRVSR